MNSLDSFLELLHDMFKHIPFRTFKNPLVIDNSQYTLPFQLYLRGRLKPYHNGAQ